MIRIEDMVEVTLDKNDDFLKVKETLTRIGLASKKDNTLYQSCHILHKQGKYYIVHFKELFALDGKPYDITENDLARRNTIANLLEEWELIKIVRPEQTDDPIVSLSQIKIIPFKEKSQWNLVTKYNIGKKSNTKNYAD
jgi:Bacteriophage translational regulator